MKNIILSITLILFLILMCDVQATTEFISEKPYSYEITEDNLVINYLDGNSDRLPFFRNVKGLNFQYGIGNNEISIQGSFNKSIIVSKFTPIKFKGSNYHYFVINSKVLKRFIFDDDWRLYWINGTGDNASVIEFQKSCYGIYRFNKSIAFYVKDACNPPVDLIYFESHSYIINVSGGNQTLFNFTGTNVRNYDCNTVAPAKNATYFDNLVMYHSYDCSANDFTAQNNGTIYGAVYTAGKYGSALSFDGTGDYVDVGNSPGLDFTTENFTITAWIYISAYDSNSHIILKRGFWRVSGYIFGISIDTLEFITSQSGAVQYTVVGAINMPTAGQWIHIAAIRNGAVGKIYINGVDKTTYSDSIISPATSGDNVFIGTYDGIIQYFNGSIDEVRIYNRTLTAAEVNASYLSRSSIFMNGTSTYSNIPNPSGQACGNITINSSEFYGGNYTISLNGVQKNILSIQANSSGVYNCSVDNIYGDFNLTIGNVVAANTPEFNKITVEVRIASICNQTLTGNTTLTVNSTCNGTGVIIGANNILLDCAGYYLTGNTTGIGVNITGYNNTVIRNCVISNFSYGIYLSNSNNTNLNNNTVCGNLGWDVWSQYNTFGDNNTFFTSYRVRDNNYYLAKYMCENYNRNLYWFMQVPQFWRQYYSWNLN